ncbi:tetratricopeptide repeat protein [Streptomyces sp. MUM 203J]|nr:tetratricopeptide repeat protein [Streptomyces sp. MUM 203J]
MRAGRVSRGVLLAGTGAVLAGAVALFALEGGLFGRAGDGYPGASGPAARAVAAAEAGALAAPAELAALIGDREAWLREHPDDHASWAALGAAYTERGTREGDPAAYPEAEKALRRSLEARPVAKGNVDAALGMSALARARGDFRAARRWAGAAGRLRPEHWRAQALLVDAYRGLGDQKAAGKSLERLRELHTGAAALTRTAQVYRDKGWREDASAVAYDAVAKAATRAERTACLSRLGDLAWERGEPSEALAQYTAALRMTPRHAPSLAGRARAVAALGRTAEAVRDWASALAVRPDPAYALEAGELDEAMGRTQAARERYGTVLDRAGEALTHGANPTLAVARYEADHGDPDKAVAWLRGEWKRGHRSADVADALGWALARSGKAEEALPYAKKATGQGRRSALFLYHRGEIERRLSMPGEARRHLEDALRTNPHFSPLRAKAARDALAALEGEQGGAPPKR